MLEEGLDILVVDALGNRRVLSTGKVMNEDAIPPEVKKTLNQQGIIPRDLILAYRKAKENGQDDVVQEMNIVLSRAYNETERLAALARLRDAHPDIVPVDITVPDPAKLPRAREQVGGGAENLPLTGTGQPALAVREPGESDASFSARYRESVRAQNAWLEANPGVTPTYTFGPTPAQPPAAAPAPTGTGAQRAYVDPPMPPKPDRKNFPPGPEGKRAFEKAVQDHVVATEQWRAGRTARERAAGETEGSPLGATTFAVGRDLKPRPNESTIPRDQQSEDTVNVLNAEWPRYSALYGEVLPTLQRAMDTIEKLQQAEEKRQQQPGLAPGLQQGVQRVGTGIQRMFPFLQIDPADRRAFDNMQKMVQAKVIDKLFQQQSLTGLQSRRAADATVWNTSQDAMNFLREIERLTLEELHGILGQSVPAQPAPTAPPTAPTAPPPAPNIPGFNPRRVRLMPVRSLQPNSPFTQPWMVPLPGQPQFPYRPGEPFPGVMQPLLLRNQDLLGLLGLLPLLSRESSPSTPDHRSIPLERLLLPLVLLRTHQLPYLLRQNRFFPRSPSRRLGGNLGQNGQRNQTGQRQVRDCWEKLSRKGRNARHSLSLIGTIRIQILCIMYSKDRDVTPEEFEQTLNIYANKYADRLTTPRGAPPDTINGIKIMGTGAQARNREFLAGMEYPYQRYARPAMQTAVDTTLADPGLIKPEGVSESLFPPRDVPEVGAMVASGGVTAAMGLGKAGVPLIRAGRGPVSRTLQTLAPGLTAAGTYTGLRQAEDPYPSMGAAALDAGVITFFDTVGTIMLRGLSGRLQTRDAEQLHRATTEWLNNIKTGRGSGDEILDPTKSIRELTGLGEKAITSTHDEYVEKIMNLMYGSGRGRPFVPAPELAEVRSALTGIRDTLRKYVDAAVPQQTPTVTVSGTTPPTPPTPSTSPASRPNVQALDQLVTDIRDGYQKVQDLVTSRFENLDTFSERAQFLRHITASGDPAFQAIFTKVIDRSNPNDLAAQALLFSPAGSHLSLQHTLNRYGLLPAQAKNVMDSLWGRIANEVTTGLEHQVNVMTGDYVKSGVLLEMLKRAGQGGNFTPDALQRYLYEHATKLQPYLTVIDDLQNIIFRRSQRQIREKAPLGADTVTQAPIDLQFNTGRIGGTVGPSVNIKGPKFGLNKYGGTPNVGLLTPQVAGWGAPVKPLALKALIQGLWGRPGGEQ